MTSIRFHRHPPTRPSSHRSFRSARRYATFLPSLSRLTKSITSRSLATASLPPKPSPSRKLSSRPRHSASCSPTAAFSRWYRAGGLNSRRASSCSVCFALHCRSSALKDSKRDCALSRWCCTWASSCFSDSANPTFWASKAFKEAMDAGSEGCVVSGL